MWMATVVYVMGELRGEDRMSRYIEVDENEAWAIDHAIRHTVQDGQQNLGKGLLLKVMNIVLEFEERRTQPYATLELPLALTEGEGWVIDHQIRCDATFNKKPVGRTLLLKVFRLLTEYANERDSRLGVDTLDSLADLLRDLPPAKEGASDQPSDDRPPDTDPEDPSSSPGLPN